MIKTRVGALLSPISMNGGLLLCIYRINFLLDLSYIRYIVIDGIIIPSITTIFRKKFRRDSEI
jgi:hypothetical protein